MLDGADCNRQFIKMHFKDKDVVQQKFVTHNIYTGRPMIFIMDPKVSHWQYSRFCSTIVPIEYFTNATLVLHVTNRVTRF